MAVKDVIKNNPQIGQGDDHKPQSYFGAKKKVNSKGGKKPPARCPVCGGNHWMSDCKDLKASHPQAPVFNKHKNTKSESEESTNSFWTAMVGEDTNPVLNDKSQGWIIDSGCTIHMTGDIDLFDEITLKDEGVVSGVGGSMRIAGKGKVKINDVKLKNVSYVPGLPVNLLSVRAAAKNGQLRVSFTEDDVAITPIETGNVVYGSVKHGLYYLNKSDQSTSSYYSDSIALPALTNDRLPRQTEPLSAAAMWHARMGHPSFSNYNHFAKIVSLPQLEFDKFTLCPTCSVSKGVMHKGTTSTTQYTTPLQLLSVDLCGPFRYEDFNSNKYFMTIRDAYSRYYVVIHLKAKSDAAHELINWIRKTETFFLSRGGYKVGAIRTDNGTEFVNQTLHDFFSDKGITHQLTVPHNSFQNGAVERAHRTLEERARCLLIGGCVPVSLWSEAISTAAYLINRTPIPSKNQAIPACLWFNRSMKDTNDVVTHIQ